MNIMLTCICVCVAGYLAYEGTCCWLEGRRTRNCRGNRRAVRRLIVLRQVDLGGAERARRMRN